MSKERISSGKPFPWFDYFLPPRPIHLDKDDDPLKIEGRHVMFLTYSADLLQECAQIPAQVNNHTETLYLRALISMFFTCMEQTRAAVNHSGNRLYSLTLPSIADWLYRDTEETRLTPETDVWCYHYMLVFADELSATEFVTAVNRMILDNGALNEKNGRDRMPDTIKRPMILSAENYIRALKASTGNVRPVEGCSITLPGHASNPLNFYDIEAYFSDEANIAHMRANTPPVFVDGITVTSLSQTRTRVTISTDIVRTGAVSEIPTYNYAEFRWLRSGLPNMHVEYLLEHKQAQLLQMSGYRPPSSSAERRRVEQGETLFQASLKVPLEKEIYESMARRFRNKARFIAAEKLTLEGRREKVQDLKESLVNTVSTNQQLPPVFRKTIEEMQHLLDKVYSSEENTRAWFFADSPRHKTPGLKDFVLQIYADQASSKAPGEIVQTIIVALCSIWLGETAPVSLLRRGMAGVGKSHAQDESIEYLNSKCVKHTIERSEATHKRKGNQDSNMVIKQDELEGDVVVGASGAQHNNFKASSTGAQTFFEFCEKGEDGEINVVSVSASGWCVRLCCANNDKQLIEAAHRRFIIFDVPKPLEGGFKLSVSDIAMASLIQNSSAQSSSIKLASQLTSCYCRLVALCVKLGIFEPIECKLLQAIHQILKKTYKPTATEVNQIRCLTETLVVLKCVCRYLRLRMAGDFDLLAIGANLYATEEEVLMAYSLFFGKNGCIQIMSMAAIDLVLESIENPDAELAHGQVFYGSLIRNRSGGGVVKAYPALYDRGEKYYHRNHQKDSLEGFKTRRATDGEHLVVVEESKISLHREFLEMHTSTNLVSFLVWVQHVCERIPEICHETEIEGRTYVVFHRHERMWMGGELVTFNAEDALFLQNDILTRRLRSRVVANYIPTKKAAAAAKLHLRFFKHSEEEQDIWGARWIGQRYVADATQKGDNGTTALNAHPGLNLEGVELTSEERWFSGILERQTAHLTATSSANMDTDDGTLSSQQQPAPVNKWGFLENQAECDRVQAFLECPSFVQTTDLDEECGTASISICGVALSKEMLHDNMDADMTRQMVDRACRKVQYKHMLTKEIVLPNPMSRYPYVVRLSASNDCEEVKTPHPLHRSEMVCEALGVSKKSLKGLSSKVKDWTIDGNPELSFFEARAHAMGITDPRDMARLNPILLESNYLSKRKKTSRDPKSVFVGVQAEKQGEGSTTLTEMLGEEALETIRLQMESRKVMLRTRAIEMRDDEDEDEDEGMEVRGATRVSRKRMIEDEDEDEDEGEFFGMA